MSKNHITDKFKMQILTEEIRIGWNPGKWSCYSSIFAEILYIPPLCLENITFLCALPPQSGLGSAQHEPVNKKFCLTGNYIKATSYCLPHQCSSQQLPT